MSLRTTPARLQPQLLTRCAAAVALAAAPLLASADTFIDLSSGSATYTGMTVAEPIVALFSFTLANESSIMATMLTNGLARQRSLLASQVQISGPSGTFAFFSRPAADGSPSWAFAARSLLPGNYTVSLIGGPLEPELFSSSVVVSPLPVPEATTSAMLALGLAALGWRLRSRRS